MERRGFLRRLLGGAAAIAVSPALPGLAEALPAATVTRGEAAAIAVGASRGNALMTSSMISKEALRQFCDNMEFPTANEMQRRLDTKFMRWDTVKIRKPVRYTRRSA